MITLDLSLPTIRPAAYWKTLPDGRIQCYLCPRKCILREGQRGMCRDRVNYQGTLYMLTYGSLTVMEVKPVENTPFYHFYPGALSLGVGSWFCNLGCIWCQNYKITRTDPPRSAEGIYYSVSPEELINEALEQNVRGILFSYNEPSISLFEYSLDVIKIAKKVELFTAYVSNGYFSHEALKDLANVGLEAIHLDIKGCAPKINPFIGGKVEYIWETAIMARKLGLHVEISTPLVPTVNDDSECIEFIAKNIAEKLGKKTPWHLLKYYPFFRAELFNVTQITSKETLFWAAKLAKKYLNYVYIGNLSETTPYDHTYCPNCGHIVIKRNKITVAEVDLTENHTCPQCGTKIDIHGDISLRKEIPQVDLTKKYWWLKTRFHEAD